MLSQKPVNMTRTATTACNQISSSAKNYIKVS